MACRPWRIDKRGVWIVLVGGLLLVPGALADPGPDAGKSVLDGGIGDDAVSGSLALFPDHDEVMSRVDALDGHPWFTVHTIGKSGQGRDIRLVEAIHPNGTVPVEDRAVTLLLTQQHGNEPAGTPAVLDLLEQIRDGDPIAETLRNQVLLVLPMANPDGSEEGERGNAEGVDTNRDHNHMDTMEARAMHEVFTRWNVHVALDHHEYGGTGLGNPFPVRVYDHDLTTLVPTHAGMHPAVLTMARDVMYDGIWPVAEEEGYSVNEYGEVTAAGVPLGHLAGGPDPGILRNHLGLHHVAGILIESRVDAYENPFHDAERREYVQYLTMVGTLRYVHGHADLFVAMREQAMREHAQERPEWYDEGDWEALTGDPLDEGERARERIPEAFRVGGDPEATVTLLERHGLPVGVTGEDNVVHNVDHGWPMHAAALMSEASSRRVLEGEGTEAVPVEDPEAMVADEAESAPGGSVVAVVLVLSAWLVRRERRTHRIAR